MASVVWDVGQRTPVHSHETWGVVGIYSGTEREVRYLKPVAPTAGAPLTPAGEEQVTVCCTTDDDVHSVAAIGNEPTVGIHVYGGNIGTIRRRSCDPRHRRSPLVRVRLGQPRGRHASSAHQLLAEDGASVSQTQVGGSAQPETPSATPSHPVPICRDLGLRASPGGFRPALRSPCHSAILTLPRVPSRDAAVRRCSAERLAGANALQANQRPKPRWSARGPLIVSCCARIAPPSSARPR